MTAGKLELARLLFDSALQPIAVGVRGSSPVVRQLLYKSRQRLYRHAHAAKTRFGFSGHRWGNSSTPPSLIMGLVESQ